MTALGLELYKQRRYYPKDNYAKAINQFLIVNDNKSAFGGGSSRSGPGAINRGIQSLKGGIKDIRESNKMNLEKAERARIESTRNLIQSERQDRKFQLASIRYETAKYNNESEGVRKFERAITTSKGLKPVNVKPLPNNLRKTLFA